MIGGPILLSDFGATQTGNTNTWTALGDGTTYGLSSFSFATVNAVPEPSSLALLGAGLGLTAWRRRRASPA